MSFVEITLSIVKIAIVLLFLLNSAAIATWADRRQSAMVQDRVGPNRAVVNLPSMLVRVILALPGVLLGAGALATFRVTAGIAAQRLTLDLQLLVLVTWLSLVVLASFLRGNAPASGFERGVAATDPRHIFLTGLAFHAVALVGSWLVPAELAVPAAAGARGALGVVLLGTGAYAAARVPKGTVALRLAGMLHAAADAVKLIWKEDFVPKNADKLLHALAPMIAMFPALVTFAVIPFGRGLCFTENGDGKFDFSDVVNGVVPVLGSVAQCKGHYVPLQIVDLNVGILYTFALASTGVIGAAIAGWASDNKFSLLGGLRAASQMVSYEVAMGLSLVGMFVLCGTVRLGPIVEWQAENAWGVFVQPLGFLLFLVALAAEGKRVPFDQPEGESEIVAGYFVEYSGMKFGMFFTGEYVDLIVSSALLTTLFFGGYALPFLHEDGMRVAFGDTVLYSLKMTHASVVALSAVAFFGKTIFVTWIQIFFRWTLPRFRYDQLMKIGWTKLLPLALANLLVTAVAVLVVQSASPAVSSMLKVVGDVTQAVVALGMLVGVVAFVAGLLEPTSRTSSLISSSARFAAARGGVHPTARQA